MPYDDKGPHPVEVSSDALHEIEAAALDTAALARRTLPLEWLVIMEPALKRQEAAAKALSRSQDPRALK